MTATHHGHPRRGCKARALDRLTTVLYPVSVGRSRSTNEDRIHMNTANEGSKDRTSNSSITSRGPHPPRVCNGNNGGVVKYYIRTSTLLDFIWPDLHPRHWCVPTRDLHTYIVLQTRGGCVPLSLSTRSVPATREPPLVQSDTRAIASQRCSITGSHNGAVLRNRTAIQNRADRHEIPIVVNIVPF
jgi:hypothetical protein